MYRNLYQFKPLSTVWYVREGEGDAGGTGGDAGQGGAGGADDLDAKIAAAVEAATKGLKAKNDELLGKLKTTSEKLKGYGDIDPEEIKTIKSRLDQDEDAKLLAEGKKQQVIEKYTERMRAQHKSELEQLASKISEAEARANSYRQSVLDNNIRAVTSGLHKSAVEDALLHARQIFTLDDKGNAVQLDSEGNPVLGKDGKTPFSPAEWIELQKELKPHWFPSATTGSSNGNSRDGKGTGRTMKRAEFDALPIARQSEVVRNGTRIVD